MLGATSAHASGIAVPYSNHSTEHTNAPTYVLPGQPLPHALPAPPTRTTHFIPPPLPGGRQAHATSSAHAQAHHLSHPSSTAGSNGPRTINAHASPIVAVPSHLQAVPPVNGSDPRRATRAAFLQIFDSILEGIPDVAAIQTRLDRMLDTAAINITREVEDARQRRAEWEESMRQRTDAFEQSVTRELQLLEKKIQRLERRRETSAEGKRSPSDREATSAALTSSLNALAAVHPSENREGPTADRGGIVNGQQGSDLPSRAGTSHSPASSASLLSQLLRRVEQLEQTAPPQEKSILEPLAASDPYRRVSVPHITFKTPSAATRITKKRDYDVVSKYPSIDEGARKLLRIKGVGLTPATSSRKMSMQYEVQGQQVRERDLAQSNAESRRLHLSQPQMQSHDANMTQSQVHEQQQSPI